VKALNFLRQQGFKYLKSVKGGITAWSEEINSKVPTDHGEAVKLPAQAGRIESVWCRR
jgi:hypothetical protein